MIEREASELENSSSATTEKNNDQKARRQDRRHLCRDVKGTAAFGVYAASKAALRSFVRTWTTDLKDRRIRSNVVSPGPINTPLASRQSTDVIARMVSTIPMGRMGEPEEVAKVALFLASDDSSFVTGIELFVDGGRAQV